MDREWGGSGKVEGTKNMIEIYFMKIFFNIKRIKNEKNALQTIWWGHFLNLNFSFQIILACVKLENKQKPHKTEQEPFGVSRERKLRAQIWTKTRLHPWFYSAVQSSWWAPFSSSATHTAHTAHTGSEWLKHTADTGPHLSAAPTACTADTGSEWLKHTEQQTLALICSAHCTHCKHWIRMIEAHRTADTGQVKFSALYSGSQKAREAFQ